MGGNRLAPWRYSATGATAWRWQVKPYGCHSKPRINGYWVKNGYRLSMTGLRDAILVQKTKFIDDTMTQTCNYRQTTPNDPRCEGCTCE
jgi:hypothetical protein